MTNQPDKCLYEFDTFRLDPFKRALWRDDESVALTSKAFELLLALVEQRGQVVGKDELMARLWPDTIVEENNLTVNMTTLRKALGENTQQPRFIITIPGRGYRFIAEVNQVWAGEEDLIVEKHARARIVVEQEEESGRETSSLPARSSTQSRRALVVVAGIALIALSVLTIWYWPSSKPIPSVHSLAVLPFQASGVAAGDEYLGLGMADALITRLSNLNQLVVRPTSAVRQYANQATASVAAGQSLKVDAVLEGSIRRSADRVRVTVQLIRASDGQPFWAEKFDEKFTDLFSVEDSISSKVAAALALRLSGAQQQLLAKHQTVSSEAYQAYLKGRYFWDRKTPAGYRKGIEYFQQAIQLEPNYALAYAGLADCYVFLGGGLPPREAMPRAKEAALKALELDSQLAEAHTTLGFVKMRYDWDRPGAEQAYRRALALNPNYASTHDWYGLFLVEVLRLAEAETELKRALELDPLSLAINVDLGWAYYVAGRHEQAVAQYQKAIEIDPNWALAHLMIVGPLAFSGRYAEALSEADRAITLSGGLYGHARRGTVYALSGRTDEARKLLAELQAQPPAALLAQFEMATFCTTLGEREQAFAWLEKLYEARFGGLAWLKADPFLRKLNDDPRYADLLRRIGLLE